MHLQTLAITINQSLIGHDRYYEAGFGAPHAPTRALRKLTRVEEFWWSILHSTRTQHLFTGDGFGIVREVEIEHDPAILSHRISRFFLNCILNKAFVSYQLWFHHLSTMDGCGLHAE